MSDASQMSSFQTYRLEAGFFKPRYGKHDFFIRKKESEEYGGPPKMSVILKVLKHAFFKEKSLDVLIAKSSHRQMWTAAWKRY